MNLKRINTTNKNAQPLICNVSGIFKKQGIMKTMKAKDLLAERYGIKGSESREKFREDAYSYYFGEIIRSCRKELNISKEKLAEAVGKKRPYISRIENGEDVRISNLLLVANALDLSIQFKSITD